MSPRVVSRASARAESTILQLLHGRVLPSPELVKDIAPVLQIDETDLLIMAGLAVRPAERHPEPYRKSAEIGELIAIASSLTDEKFQKLIDAARSLKTEHTH
ncbi:transcriptional regulator [Streptomyces tsukubensis]|nr:transcriptional regulator [Streptomyces tsukubensis]